MAFEKFEDVARGRGAGSAEPMISLRKSGSIGVNRAAMDAYVGDAEGAVLYFDEDDNQVGIEFVDDADLEGAYTISRTSGTGSITPSAFLERYDLVPDVTTQFDPSETETDDAELVVIDLDEPIGTYGSPDDEEE